MGTIPAWLCSAQVLLSPPAAFRAPSEGFSWLFLGGEDSWRERDGAGVFLPALTFRNLVSEGCCCSFPVLQKAGKPLGSASHPSQLGLCHPWERGMAPQCCPWLLPFIWGSFCCPEPALRLQLGCPKTPSRFSSRVLLTCLSSASPKAQGKFVMKSWAFPFQFQKEVNEGSCYLLPERGEQLYLTSAGEVPLHFIPFHRCVQVPSFSLCSCFLCPKPSTLF